MSQTEPINACLTEAAIAIVDKGCFVKAHIFYFSADYLASGPSKYDFSDAAASAWPECRPLNSELPSVPQIC